MIIHHTDADREFAYDRDSPIGKLSKGLDEAPKCGWSVVSMKDDCKTVFPSNESVLPAPKLQLATSGQSRLACPHERPNRR